jgi:hypothetical protein
MNPGLKLALDLWPLILAAIALIVWLVRLEGRVSGIRSWVRSLEKRTDALQIKHEQLDSKTVQQLSDVRESLARIEGALGVQRNAPLAPRPNA